MEGKQGDKFRTGKAMKMGQDERENMRNEVQVR